MMQAVSSIYIYDYMMQFRAFGRNLLHQVRAMYVFFWPSIRYARLLDLQYQVECIYCSRGSSDIGYTAYKHAYCTEYMIKSLEPGAGFWGQQLGTSCSRRACVFWCPTCVEWQQLGTYARPLSWKVILNLSLSFFFFNNASETNPVAHVAHMKWVQALHHFWTKSTVVRLFSQAFRCWLWPMGCHRRNRDGWPGLETCLSWQHETICDDRPYNMSIYTIQCKKHLQYEFIKYSLYWLCFKFKVICCNTICFV